MPCCVVHQIEWAGDRDCPVCMLVDERQRLIDRALISEQKLEWLTEWRADLVYALAIMDEKGAEGVTEIQGDAVCLWKLDWQRLRHTLVVLADSIQEQQA